jgi:glycosyltransferase involved in cell wall biosynthesis
MSGCTIGLVHPPPDAMPSGGNVFNRQLLAHAAHAGAPFIALCGEPDERVSRHGDVLVWDSLLLGRIRRLGRSRTGILLHYLPSLQPGLGARRTGLEAMEDAAAACADFVVTTSIELATVAAVRWPGKHVVACEPGVDGVFCRRASRAARPSVTLVSVANLLPAKGHDGLLQLLHRLRQRQWHWHVVGHGGEDGAAAARLQADAERMGLRDRITLHGVLPQDEVAALMAKSDLLLHPSLFESYAMVLAEARAVGLPALSFRVGAAQRLIEHGATGFVAAAGDWSEFGRHLETLLAEPELRAALERNLAAAPVRGWDRTYAEFRAVCESMLRQAPSLSNISVIPAQAGIEKEIPPGLPPPQG